MVFVFREAGPKDARNIQWALTTTTPQEVAMAEKILQSVTDKTTQYTITESEFWKLNEVAASMDEIGRLGGVDTKPHAIHV